MHILLSQVISGLKNFNAKSVESVVKAANAGGALLNEGGVLL